MKPFGVALMSAISRRSLPKGRNRKEESSVPSRNNPNGPRRRKNRKIRCAQGLAKSINSMLGIYGSSGFRFKVLRCEVLYLTLPAKNDKKIASALEVWDPWQA